MKTLSLNGYLEWRLVFVSSLVGASLLTRPSVLVKQQILHIALHCAPVSVKSKCRQQNSSLSWPTPRARNVIFFFGAIKSFSRLETWLVVKGTYCSCRGPGSVPSTHCGSQLPRTPAAEDRAPSWPLQAPACT